MQKTTTSVNTPYSITVGIKVNILHSEFLTEFRHPAGVEMHEVWTTVHLRPFYQHVHKLKEHPNLWYHSYSWGNLMC